MEKVLDYWIEEEGYSGFYTDDYFCAYVSDGDEFFIAHFKANKGKGYDLFKKVQEVATEKGAKYITANIDLNDANKENYTNKTKIIIGHGFKIMDVTNKRITVLKQLY